MAGRELWPSLVLGQLAVDMQCLACMDAVAASQKASSTTTESQSLKGGEAVLPGVSSASSLLFVA